MTKELVSSAIKDFPKEFDLDELIEKLIFIEKVEAARTQVEDGKIITHSEMKNRLLYFTRGSLVHFVAVNITNMCHCEAVP